GLLQINNVNAVALAKDVFLHLRSPAPYLVAEMHAGFQKFFHRNRNQTLISFAVNWFNVLTITAGPFPGRATNPSYGNGFRNFGMQISNFEFLFLKLAGSANNIACLPTIPSRLSKFEI